jgi:hypothetical protein
MSASYNENLPTVKDWMRLQLGDTNVDPVENALRSDEEYLAALNTEGDKISATVFLAESLAAEFGQEPDSVDASGKAVTWKDRVKTWLALAERLRARAAGVTASAAASRKPSVGQMKATAPVESTPGYPDANSGYYRGDPNNPWGGW